MSFSVTYGDALEYKGDAVLNSLGTNGAVYGKLCKNINKWRNSKDYVIYYTSYSINTYDKY